MTTLKAHDITLERSNNEKIAAERIYDHEIDILKAIHGEDRVLIRETYDVDVDDDVTPINEFERLKRKYNRKDVGQADIVQRVVRNVRELATLMGMELKSDPKKPLPKSQNVDNRKKGVAKKAAEAKKD